MRVTAGVVLLWCFLLTAWGQAPKAQPQQAQTADDSRPDPLRDELVRSEHILAEAQQQKNANLLRATLADESLYVAYNGLVLTKTQIVKDLKYIDVSRYQMKNFKVRRLGPAAALLTYDLDTSASVGGQDVPAKQYASSVWMNRGGHWVLIFHQETPAHHG